MEVSFINTNPGLANKPTGKYILEKQIVNPVSPKHINGGYVWDGAVANRIWLSENKPQANSPNPGFVASLKRTESKFGRGH
jgi:hypothetical protein